MHLAPHCACLAALVATLPLLLKLVSHVLLANIVPLLANLLVKRVLLEA